VLINHGQVLAGVQPRLDGKEMTIVPLSSLWHRAEFHRETCRVLYTSRVGGALFSSFDRSD